MRWFDSGFSQARLRVHDLAGDDTPLLFLHGMGCAASCDYPMVADHAALRNRRRILVDLLGAGFSDRPADFPYTVAAHTACILRLIDQLQLGPFDLFGHSAGGAIAIEVASRTPTLRKLVLSEPNLDGGGGAFSRAVAQMSEADFIARGHAALVREANRSGDPIWAGASAASLPAAVHRLAVSLVEGASPSWRQRLEALDCPRTVLFGSRSLPDADTDALPRHGIAVRIVADSGHSMANENPSALAECIAAALAQ